MADPFVELLHPWRASLFRPRPRNDKLGAVAERRPRFKNTRIRVVGYLDESGYGPSLDDCFRPKDDVHPNLLIRKLPNAEEELWRTYGHEVVVEGFFKYKIEPAGGKWDSRPPPLTDELIGPLIRARIVTINPKTCPYVRMLTQSEIELRRKIK
ncbi:hypothetical protein NDN01_23895 [Sphingomonas sp. QA11]|uniref:hypothetical protein n=1 Tax=Sphingomonas sp. QA11 TaxID=2950605 RepID=UPI002349D094|nr:hypothetical protein [Sphingomonas sp. QA11]WCM26990.1 hypothetical protein NDN01_23895 [Sphingomonas sp. QA11]